jgi:hypothetical protein
LVSLLNLFINPATIAAVLYLAWSALILFKTSSPRMVVLVLFTCAMVGAVIFTAIGIWFRGLNWEFTWGIHYSALLSLLKIKFFKIILPQIILLSERLF